MATKTITRKWELFQGRNRFYCDGRLITAPYSGVFFLTVFLITGTSTLFFIFDCKYMAENVTVAIPIIGGLLFLFTMSALLRTSLSDPGIIPRATFEEAVYVEKQIEVTNSTNSPTYRPPPRTKEVLVKGQTVKLKYCFTCKIFRPPRASHCSLCDNCVDRFDHHCPWVGNCVGRRNYRFFYMFIISLAFLAVFIFSCAVAHLILITKVDHPFLDAVKESPPSVVVALICFFSVWSIVGLAGFHTYLTTSNQTTNEDIKGSFTRKRGQANFNPYSKGGICLNCFFILCGPLTPSLIDRRGIATETYRTEINRCTMQEMNLAVQNFYQTTSTLNAIDELEPQGIYKKTPETIGNHAESVSELVKNIEPPAAATYKLVNGNSIQYKSQPDLSDHPIRNLETASAQISKSQSCVDEFQLDLENLHLDPVEVLENGQPSFSEKPDCSVLNKDSLVPMNKETKIFNATNLRLLQDTTMIESALDLDSLEDSCTGTNNPVELMNAIV